MKHGFQLVLVIIFLGALLSLPASAQSDEGVSLGNLARTLRRVKAPTAPAVIDNDNLSKVMDDVENSRLKGKPPITFDDTGRNFQMGFPDGTCSLSFNANVTAVVTDPYAPEDLPEAELAKLDGPATLDGDTLQFSLFNGTAWNVKEVTVGFTIVRRDNMSAAVNDAARLLPPVVDNAVPAEKRSDLTVLFHLKGAAAPQSTAIFHEKLDAALGPDQEWHWAIVQAMGIPPTTAANLPAH